MRDFIIKLKNHDAIDNRAILKSKLLKVLGDRVTEAGVRWIYSQDPFDETGLFVRVRLDTTYDSKKLVHSLERVGAVEIQTPELTNGQSVEMAIWVALENNQAKAANIPAELEVERKNDIVVQKLQSALGSCVADLDILILDDARAFAAASKRMQFPKFASRALVSGTITDIDHLNRAMRAGIGGAKAYGFGLPDVRLT